MNFFKSICGTYKIRISSASIAEALTAINVAQIHIFDVTFVDELTVTGTILAYTYRRLSALLVKRGDSLKIVGREGLFWTLLSLRRRPILLLGISLFTMLALYLPTRVLFVRVEGNKAVPTNAIIEKAEFCGIKFGVSRRNVRSEKVKNALLAAMPELKWAGVNTYGCVAVISVRERSTDEQKMHHSGVASIIAKTDGVITELTVIRGTPLCKEGQAVKKGQVLVSGYTDCGLMVKAEAADAEIFAKTRHDLCIVTPVKYQKVAAITPAGRNYYLKIGKKLINFSKDSGISSATCVKMYKENYLQLPGSFRLPIALVTEELYLRTLVTDTEDDFGWLTDYSGIYLKNQMISGNILQSDFDGRSTNEKYTLTANFACLELIGQMRYEEILDGNGKGN